MAGSSLDRACEHGYLWPVVADAVETYRNTRIVQGGKYELVWRLIHLWEVIAMTLVAASVSRIQALRTEVDSDARKSLLETFLRAREALYGKSWDESTGASERRQAALQGSMDSWLEVLGRLSKTTEPRSAFLLAVASFLGRPDAIEPSSFLSGWKRSCDVPVDASKGKWGVLDAFRFINSFRNRFAHVPFPPDSLEQLNSGLEDVTNQLFDVEPRPTCHEHKPSTNVEERASSPLTGGLIHRGHAFIGREKKALDEEASDEVLFGWPCPRDKKGSFPERWQACPFVHIDTGLRPHLLTRLIDEEEAIWEYTRYRAEANAVLRVRKHEHLEFLPVPNINDYAPTPVADARGGVTDSGPVAQAAAEAPPVAILGEEGVERDRRVTIQLAVREILEGEYDRAIPILQGLVQQDADYHVAWLLLGRATREKALRIASEHPDEGLRLLHDSVSQLSEAIKHGESRYRAEGYYQRSKAYYHLAGRTIDHQFWPPSVEDAQRACSLSYETKYLTWLDHLESEYMRYAIQPPQ